MPNLLKSINKSHAQTLNAKLCTQLMRLIKWSGFQTTQTIQLNLIMKFTINLRMHIVVLIFETSLKSLNEEHNVITAIT